MPSDPPLALGPFRLRVDPARAAAYAHETGGDGASVPLAYPAIWFAEPSLSSVVRDVCAKRDVVPVHEAQSFSYEAPLVSGESYDLTVTMSSEETPPRLTMVATVVTPEGEPCARIETILRLVPRAGFGSAS